MVDLEKKLELDWERISSRARAVFNFGIKKAEWLEKCKTARFIALIPFIADCKKAEETSLTHLAVYIMFVDDSTKELYFHKPEDDEDVYSRLQPISNFNEGNQDIIKCCMDLLALNLIAEYQRDKDHDKAIGKYNPFNTGKWDYKSLSERLIRDIKGSITPIIENIYSIDDSLYFSCKE